MEVVTWQLLLIPHVWGSSSILVPTRYSQCVRVDLHMSVSMTPVL